MDFRKMAGVKSKLHDALRETVVTLTALVAEETIENITTNNQVDTGAMRATVFMEVDGSTVTVNDREAALAIAEALSKIPGVKSKKAQEDFQPEMNITWNPEGPFQGKAALGAEYAKWQEKRIKFIAPAFDHVKRFSNRVTTQIFKKALRS